MISNLKNFTITLALLFLTSLCYSQILDYPQKIDSNNQIVVHTAYTLSYNETYEQANWVKYMLCGSDLDSTTAKRKNNFKQDTMIHTGTAEISDYRYSGYDRGHLSPAANFVESQIEMNESFYFSNIAPQHPSFNRGIWKRLENYERKLAIEKDTIYVITGGVLTDSLKTIGDNEVAVPEYFYKIMYGDSFLLCFLMKNEKSDIHIFEFMIPLTEIEKITGLEFSLD